VPYICPGCNDWWNGFGLAYPCGPYIHPGTLIPSIAKNVLRGVVGLELLDIGGGGGVVGYDLWREQGIQKLSVLDIFWPKTAPPGFVLGDGLKAVEIFGEESFDITQSCEVIEHMDKAKGGQLLDVLCTVARKFVILTTPNGFLEQDPTLAPGEPWATNPYQKHICGWTGEELAAKGFSIYMNNFEPTMTFGGSQIIAYKKL